MHQKRRGAMHRKGGSKAKGRYNAPNAKGEKEGETGTHRKTTSPQRDLTQGALGLADFSGKVQVVSALSGGELSVPYLRLG